MKLDYVVVQDQDGWYIASVPSMPGCFTASKDLEEIPKRIVEAAAIHFDTCWLDSARKLKFVGTHSVEI